MFVYIIRFITFIVFLATFLGCKEDSNVSIKNPTELMQRTATIVSMQKKILNRIESVYSMTNNTEKEYTINCDGGGTLSYDISEEKSLATLTYDRCRTFRSYSDGNSTLSQKDGILIMSGNELNVTVLFEGDFNNTVYTNENVSVTTIVKDESSINFVSNGIYFITNNLTLVSDNTQFKAIDATYHLTQSSYDETLLVAQYSGYVLTSADERLTLQEFSPDRVRPFFVILGEHGDFLSGDLLYHTNSDYVIDVADINQFAPNYNITAYLW